MTNHSLILHGENIIASRQKLVTSIQNYTDKGFELFHLEAKNLDVPTLEEKLGSTNLFGNQHGVIIEGLHSLPISARKKTLIKMLSATKTALILWEKRSLTPTMLKPFAGAMILEFKPTNQLFKWLDELSPMPTSFKTQSTLLQKALYQDGAELCFFLLIRQVRMLLSSKSGVAIQGAPFMISKISRQSQKYSLPELLQLHQQLYLLDLRQKTSQLRGSLALELDLLMRGMYSTA